MQHCPPPPTEAGGSRAHGALMLDQSVSVHRISIHCRCNDKYYLHLIRMHTHTHIRPHKRLCKQHIDDSIYLVCAIARSIYGYHIIILIRSRDIIAPFHHHFAPHLVIHTPIGMCHFIVIIGNATFCQLLLLLLFYYHNYCCYRRSAGLTLASNQPGWSTNNAAVMPLPQYNYHGAFIEALYPLLSRERDTMTGTKL